MIKRYNQFVKENKTNEDFEDFDAPEVGGEEIESDTEFQDETIDQAAEVTDDEVTDDQVEEEGGEYVGKKMMQELSDELDSTIESDGSINYDGKKINFYSETEMFHVDKKKFETVKEVVDYLNGLEQDISSEDEPGESDKDILDSEEEREQDQEEFESKSYKT